MALGTAVRQQGVAIAFIAALYLLLTPGRGLAGVARWKAAALWLIVFVLCSGGLKLAVDSSGDTSKSAAFVGPFYQLALYDLAGIAHGQDLELSFPALERSAPHVVPEHRPTRDRILMALDGYSPDRQDHMGASLERAQVSFPLKALFSDWLALIPQYPGAYLAHRLEVLSWITGWHDTTKCLPYALGISAQPEEMVAEVGLEPGINARAQMLERLGSATLFLFRPVIYLLLSLAVAGFLIKRDWRRHRLIITIQIAGLIYAATYLFLGIACDFRYTYFSTLTALFGLAYAFVVGFVEKSRGPLESD